VAGDTVLCGPAECDEIVRRSWCLGPLASISYCTLNFVILELCCSFVTRTGNLIARNMAPALRSH
jgi:hypothetical protein